MARSRRPLVWLADAIKSPPFSQEARIEAGFLLRRLQDGEKLSLPHSRPMPSIGDGCHELRIVDANVTWRIVYQLEHDTILIVAIFKKSTRKTPDRIIDLCRQRLKHYHDE